MHCYEYLAMHILLKSELKRLFPNRPWRRHDVEEAFSRLDVDTLEDVQNLEPKQYLFKLGIPLNPPVSHTFKAA